MASRFHYLDTNVLIGIIEPVTPLSSAQADFLARLESGDFIGVTSEIALSECLVKPFADDDQFVIDAYQTLFSAAAMPALAVMAVTRDILVGAASLRARMRMSLPDAIHVATAEVTDCAIFVTDDLRLSMPEGLVARRWTSKNGETI